MSEREQDYKGVPLSQLRIDTICWSPERVDHLANRSTRKGRPDMAIEPEWATEAALDPDRLVALAGPAHVPKNQALRVVGFSPSVPPTGAVLKVWIWNDEPDRSTQWNGGSAALAGDSARRAYERERRDEKWQ